MSRLQPVGQKRLTNICIVRLKRCGKRFEVAAYRNTVVAWRNKVERDIDEVLQVHTIFANVDKGVLAKSEDLVEAFGTGDEDVVCVEILNRGEFQVSEQERQMQVDALFRDVASRVTDMCVNPDTQRPYPLSTVERAMRETLHFAPAVNRSAKQQALQVARQLESAAVLPIMRAKMHLRLVVAEPKLDTALTSLKSLATGGTTASATAPAPAAAAGGTASASVGTGAVEGGMERLLLGATESVEGSASVAIHADPGLFRALSELAKELGGTLQMIELKASAETPGEASASAAASAGAKAAAAASATAPPTAGASVPPPAAAATAGRATHASASAAVDISEPAAAAAVGASGGDGGAKGGASSCGASSARSDADARRAERMFKLNLRNAEKGDPVAQLEVGKAYVDGRGVEADVAQGKHWLEQAAQQGVNAAVQRLQAIAL